MRVPVGAGRITRNTWASRRAVVSLVLGPVDEYTHVAGGVVLRHLPALLVRGEVTGRVRPSVRAADSDRAQGLDSQPALLPALALPLQAGALQIEHEADLALGPFPRQLDVVPAASRTLPRLPVPTCLRARGVATHRLEATARPPPSPGRSTPAHRFPVTMCAWAAPFPSAFPSAAAADSGAPGLLALPRSVANRCGETCAARAQGLRKYRGWSRKADSTKTEADSPLGGQETQCQTPRGLLCASFNGGMPRGLPGSANPKENPNVRITRRE
eukprot:scaffold149_cov315-Pinguiococcus_pyrenoidosus.AAC.37